jgi:exopolysaccharide biosynthesis polyprenyl glycosylphosphotransferase
VKTTDGHDLSKTGSRTTELRVDDAGADASLLQSERTRSLIEARRDGKTHRRGWIARRSLIVADLVGILAAFAVGETVFYSSTVAGRYGTLDEIGLFVASLPGWLILAEVYGLYDRDEEHTDHSTADEVFSVFNMLTVGTFVFVAIAYLFPGLAAIPFEKVLVFWVSAILLVVLARTAARGICRHADAYTQNTVIVGAGLVGQRVALKLLHHREYGVNLVGFVDEHPRERAEGLGDLTILGQAEDLRQIVHDYDIERVIIAFLQHPHTQLLAIIRELNDLDVQVDIVPRLFEVIGPHATMHAVEGLPLVGLPPAHLDRGALVLKRAMDILGSALGLLILSPFFAVVAFSIKLDSPGPVFFRQIRVGRGGKEFEILKFRTMGAGADEHKGEVAHLNKHRGSDERMFKVRHDPRVTRFGRLLRRYSLDEFPQLVSVLRGQMSLVGPRPLIPEEHHHVGGWARRRLDLKPGMTGLWQVLGRDDIPFGEMVGLDYRYVTTWSVGRDLTLMLKTFAVLARSDG